jgi:hypothetical protein
VLLPCLPVSPWCSRCGRCSAAVSAVWQPACPSKTAATATCCWLTLTPRLGMLLSTPCSGWRAAKQLQSSIVSLGPWDCSSRGKTQQKQGETQQKQGETQMLGAAGVDSDSERDMNAQQS